MYHVMLDLETMGTSHNAPIIAIGAVEFDFKTKKLGKEFYEVIDLQSNINNGAVMEANTVLWWMNQSDEARKALLRKGEPLHHTLSHFYDYMTGCCALKDISVWGNGAAFDNALLAAAYKRLGLPVPWNFWNDRCYRTIKALHPDIKMKREGTHHNALDDAKDQAVHLMEMLG